MRNCVWLSLVMFALGCGGSSDANAPAAVVPLAINGPSRVDNSNGISDPNPTEGSDNSIVEQLYQKAQQAARAGQSAAAVEAISQAIGEEPDDARLFRLRADVYSVMGKYANARADLALAVRIEPQNAELRNIRGYFLMSRGLTKEALVDFDQALELNPEFTAAWNNRGLVHLAHQDYQAAVTDFGKAATIDGTYADALNNRGFAKFKMGQLSEALSDLKRTVELKPGYTTAWNNCGLVYMEQKEYALAIEAFSQACQLAPNDIRWLTHRREALKRLGRYTEAGSDTEKIRWLTTLQQLTQQTLQQPSVSSVWIARARHLADGSEFNAAVKDYARALTLNSADHEALAGRAEVWLKMGEAGKAIADCDESLIAEATSAAFSVRGDAWFALKNYDQAIEDFEAARRFDENVAEAYRRRGELRRTEGNSEMADADLRKAKSITAALNGETRPAKTDSTQLPFPE
jgi:tetratricopeptide (TPR) repeat protein